MLTESSIGGTGAARERLNRRERLDVVAVPTDVRESTLFDWVPVDRMFVAPYGRPFSQKKVDGLLLNFDFAALGVLYLSFRSEEDNYAILDGQHRMVAAMQKGHTELPSRIYIDLSYEQEAALYVRFATVNRQTALDRFRARLEAKEPVALHIEGIIREHGGLEIAASSKGREGFFCAVDQAEKTLRRDGADGLIDVCRILRAAWETAPRAWTASMITGVAGFWIRYRRNKELRYDRLVSVLQLRTPESVLARAAMIASTDRRSNVSGSIGMAILHLYNDGIRSHRLPGWAAMVYGDETREERREQLRRTMNANHRKPVPAEGAASAGPGEEAVTS